MKTLLGKAICWLLRRHKWRRLRRSEWLTTEVPVLRICDRCHITRAVRTKEKA